ncbi:MAG: peptidase M75 family protein [Cryobacterium sp.]|nr:peptidase M75 family protein [Cryobacterium sp.]
MHKKFPALLAVAAAGGLLLSGCVPNPTATSQSLAVSSTETDCVVEANTATSGTLTFTVKNDGHRISEFYILAENGLSIVGEVENIAPGGTRDLTVVAQPGSYFTVCKPGMIGAGVGQAAFTVTGETVAVSADEQEAVNAAVASYVGYVKTQTSELLPAVEEFAAAYVAGDDGKARALFPIVRINYERIEPTAEQFGDLDPAIDYRKPGAEAEGLEFTGFHRIEMDLWIDEARLNYPDEQIDALDTAARTVLADKLVADVTELNDLVHDASFVLTLSDITNGAIGLLDEVAAPDGKLPGEENEFAHTDLYDFYANVEGAEVAYSTVRDIAASRGEAGAALVAELDTQFAAMKSLLETYGDYASGFVFYDTVGQDERNELGAQLNALSEPLSQLTHTVLGVASD